MLLIWGDWDFVGQAAITAELSPPDEVPAGEWDTWDFRGLFNQPVITSDQTDSNNLPLTFAVPWQIYP